MSVKFLKIRFNLDRPEDKAAYETLHCGDCSISRYAIQAVNALNSIRTQKEQEMDHLLAIRHIVQEELYKAGLYSKDCAIPPISAEIGNSEENHALDDFLDFFQ